MMRNDVRDHCSLRSCTEFPEYEWRYAHSSDPLKLAGAEMIAADQAILADVL